jgi:tryptophanyl-tRNA synthetase
MALDAACINDDAETRTLSGMRPTGALHIGHYFGAVKNWLDLQESMQCFFFVADWHALTSEYEDSRRIGAFIPEMVKDWLAAGLDPERCAIFRQSAVKETAELSLILSMLTPVSWLERCPTYKEQIQQLSHKDLGTYGFLGYPVLMTADIIMYRPRWVPVGQDQLPHLELSREIARRFNNFYGVFFPEPEARLTPQPKCPGLDGRKMSKSYNNGILLSESMAEISPKIREMLTDTARMRRSDPGNPEHCNLFPYHALLSDAETQAEIRAGCLSASMGCVDCKALLLKSLERFLAPMRERRAHLDARPGLVEEVLAAGNEKARAEARKTMEGVRQLIGF